MTKLRSFLLVLLIILAMDSMARFGGGFSTGYRFGNPKWNSFEQFKTGYSTYYKDQINKDFSGFRLGNGYAINGDMTAGVFVIGLRYSQYRSSDQVSFKTGGSRHFDAQQNLLAMAMGFGYQAKQGHVQFTMALISGNDRIDSYYAYADGTKSFAAERALNGKYTALRMGWSARVEFSLFFMYAGVEYVYGKLAGIGLPLSDSFTSSFGIPTNYEGWAADPVNYNSDDYVMPDLNGLRFEIGLRLNLEKE